MTGTTPTTASRPATSVPSATASTVEDAGVVAREAAVHPVRVVSPWYRRIAIGLGIVRVGLGATALVVPEMAGRAWIGEGASGRDKAVLLRALGGRDAALGLGVLLSAHHSGALRRWVLLGALSDFFDTVSTAAGFTALPTLRRWLVLGASAGAVATAAVVAPNLGPSSD